MRKWLDVGEVKVDHERKAGGLVALVDKRGNFKCFICPDWEDKLTILGQIGQLAYEAGYRDGKRDVQNDLRKALGVDEQLHYLAEDILKIKDEMNK